MRKAIDESDYTPNSLAKALKISAPTVAAWTAAGEIAPAKNITGDNLLRACELLRVRPEWVLYKRGEMKKQAPSEDVVNHSITGRKQPLSVDSARLERARLLADQLLDISMEMRELIDTLVEADRQGGAAREMTIAGLGYVLRSIPMSQNQKKVK